MSGASVRVVPGQGPLAFNSAAHLSSSSTVPDGLCTWQRARTRYLSTGHCTHVISVPSIAHTLSQY
eukprot:2571902-Rhodomonas_salina.1